MSVQFSTESPTTRTSLRSDITILAISCIFYAVIMQWAFQIYFYNYDFFYYACNAERYKHWFDAALTRDFDFRYRPLTYLFFQLQYTLFDLSLTGYFVTTIFIHCCNSLIIYLLCQRFSTNRLTPLIASSLFLTSSLFWSSIIDIIAIGRHIILLLSMVGVIVFSKNLDKNKPGVSIITIACFVSSLFISEDMIILPALLFAVFAIRERNQTGLSKINGNVVTILLCFMIAIIFLVYAKRYDVGRSYELSYGWHSLQKLITLPRELLQYLLVPRRDWGLCPSLFVRLLPAMLLFSAVAYLWGTARREDRKIFLQKNKKLILFSLSWTLITAIPYLSRPSGWTWYNRYLHIPSVGLFMLIGALGQFCCNQIYRVFSGRILAKILIVVVLGYLMVFGIFSTVLIWQRLCLESTHCYVTGKREAKQLFGLLYKLQSLSPTGSDRIQLNVTGSPFPSERLRTFFGQYLHKDITLVNESKHFVDGVPAYCITYEHDHWGELIPSAKR